MPTITTSAAIDDAVAAARSLPELVARVQSLDPGLAASLESKPLAASRTPGATLVATALAYVSARYGLGWDETTTALLSGVVLLGVGYVMRVISNTRIAGVFSVPQPAAAIAPVTNIKSAP